MKCPIDHVDLMMSERQGVEIDYCPTCRGVWLDRGELDKLIERAARDERQQDRPERNIDRDERPQYVQHKKKKSSLLGELFDF